MSKLREEAQVRRVEEQRQTGLENSRKLYNDKERPDPKDYQYGDQNLLEELEVLYTLGSRINNRLGCYWTREYGVFIYL